MPVTVWCLEDESGAWNTVRRLEDESGAWNTVQCPEAESGAWNTVRCLEDESGAWNTVQCPEDESRGLEHSPVPRPGGVVRLLLHCSVRIRTDQYSKKDTEY